MRSKMSFYPKATRKTVAEAPEGLVTGINMIYFLKSKLKMGKKALNNIREV